MDTPICDFVREYAGRGTLRAHMPGHKGAGPLGFEALDITEIDGADSLYEASGIIARSEANASRLFGCDTYYSTEGSSQCIRAMLYLALIHAKSRGRVPRIAAGRNAHKTFMTGAALLDLDVVWLGAGDSYLSCRIDPKEILAAKPTAVYVTSPDYLGGMADIRSIAAVCHENDILLLVDNAHGAYLRFVEPSLHPMDLGADLCCDSAHKTLPVLTGGAYLHVGVPELSVQAKNALALFGSTSPSYLILQSLDGANPYLERFPALLREFIPRVAGLKEALTNNGWELGGEEPLKATILTKSCGYTGAELAAILEKAGVVCEFADPDHLVLMLSPGMELARIEAALCAVPRRAPIAGRPPQRRGAVQVMSIREAALSPSETIAVTDCVGRILASASVGCPPAVPIAVCGQRLDEDAAACFAYYGIEECVVVR